MPHPDQERRPSTVEPRRLRLIQERLRSEFYDVPPASERIAACIMADLKDLEDSSPALPS